MLQLFLLLASALFAIGLYGALSQQSIVMIMMGLELMLNGVTVAAAAFWFYQRSQEIQAANAQKALLNAKQSLSAGNLQLAQTDLQSVYSRYGSTEAGVEAAMLATFG